MSVEHIVTFIVCAAVLYGYRKLRASKKRLPYGQTFEDNHSPTSDASENDIPQKLSLPKRVAGIAFLSVWLVGWSFGVYFASREWLSLNAGDSGFFFLIIWLAFAIPAWFFVAWTIFRLLRGDDVEFEFSSDGD